jgi:hypothetical protein
VAREHARMARLNLDVVLRHREMRERVPGGALVQLAGEDDGQARRLSSGARR